MPVYEYVCAKCGKTSELLRKMSEADAPAKCEHCGSTKTKRAQSVFSASAATGGGDAPVCPSSGQPCGCAGSCGLN